VAGLEKSSGWESVLLEGEGNTCAGDDACNFNNQKSAMPAIYKFSVLETLEGLSHEIDFKNLDKNLQNLA
jgi:hypothetical protein